MQSSFREARFYAACEDAVRATSAPLEALAGRVEALTEALTATEYAAAPGSQFQAVLAEIRKELEPIRTERLANRGTFNVVLFGRTTVGKSTLIEALTQGDGRSTLGEPVTRADGKTEYRQSDRTREVQERSCGPLRVFDTPGFAGRDQQVLGDELKKARRAAASADVVVICFSDVNQSYEEFETVARWIGDYQKLAVAVLNVKNPRWRWPDSEHLGVQIAGHARHIREELARVGLPGTPVVAVNAQNAMFARARGQYCGANPGLRAHFLKKFGDEGLDELSNFPALEELLAKMVRCGGAGLRYGSARRFVATAMAQAAARLQDTSGWARHNAERAELTVAATLAVTGRPDPDAQDCEAFLARFGELERLRGAAFEVPAVPRAVAYGQDLIGSRFRPLERDAAVRAREFVQRKLDERECPAEGEFERAVHAHDQIEAVLSQVIVDYQLFLQRSHDVLAQKRYDGFSRKQARPPQVDAERGQWLSRTSVGVSAAGILAAVAIAASTPPGWIVLAGTLGGLVLEGGGKRLRKKAQADHERALAEALASASGAVAELFAELGLLTEAEFVRLRRIALVSAAGTAVTTALDGRELQHSCAWAADFVRRFQPEQSWQGHHPRHLTWRAVEECERDRGVREAAGREALWLGTERDGRRRARVRWHRPARRDVLSEIRAFGAALPAPVAAEAAEEWIAAVGRTLGDEALTRDLHALARQEEPAIVFCGDYDSGKSSLIKRLLGGQADIPTSALPDTDRVHHYSYRPGLILADTPGFQATAARADDATIWAIATAAVVVLVFTPGLVTCDPADLVRVLYGDPASHVPGRAARCLFVVNHADRFGTDPEYDPAGFAAAREHGLDQLRHDVPGLAHGVALSAVPFGALQPRSWDGVREFAKGLAALRGPLGSDHGAVAALNGGQILLGRRYAQLTRDRAGLTPRIRQARSAGENAARLRAEAEACYRDCQEALLRGVGRFIDDLISTVLSTRFDVRRDNLARLQRLGEDQEFWRVIEGWAAETDHKVGGFEALCARQAAVGFERPASRDDFPGFAPVDDARMLGRHSGSPGGQAVAWTRKVGAAATKLAKADEIVNAGGNLGRFLEGAGPALGVVGGVTSIGLLFKELIIDGPQDEAGRRRAIRALHRAGDEWARSVLAADLVMERLAALHRELGAEEARQYAELARLRDLARLLDDRAAACAALSARAAELLGGNPRETQ